MPVYEYLCKNCNKKYEVFHKSLKNQDEVSCPDCKSFENKKLLSSFQASISNTPDNSCASGNCDMPMGGGCASGMCGLN